MPGQVRVRVGAVGEPAEARRRRPARPRGRRPRRVAVSIASGETVRRRAAARRSSPSTASTRTCPTSSAGRSPAASSSAPPTSTPGGGSRCSARRRAHRSSPTSTRSGARSPSPACGSGWSASSPRSGSTFGVDRDDEIHIPVTAAQRLFGVDRIDALAVKAPERRRRRAAAAAAGRRAAGQVSRRGVLRRHADPDPRHHRADPRPAHLGARRDRRDLAAGRRRRRLQHPAGQRARADPRDRPAQGARRPAARHPAAVPHRGGAALRRRRADRHRARRRAPRCWSARSPRCPPSSPGGRRRWRSPSPRRSASSSAWRPPGGPAGSTRSWPCARSDGPGAARTGAVGPTGSVRGMSASVCVAVGRRAGRLRLRPDHPLNPVRVDLTMRLARELGVLDLPTSRWCGPSRPTDDELLRSCTSQEYIEAVRPRSADPTQPTSRAAWAPRTPRPSPTCTRRPHWWSGRRVAARPGGLDRRGRARA